MATEAVQAPLEGSITDLLATNASLTQELADILVNFDRRMGRLEEAILPVQERSGALRLASENLAKAAELTHAVLADFDVARGLDALLSAPVGDDIGAYLANVDKLLDVASKFQDRVDHSRAAEPALKAAQDLLTRAMGRCEEKLKQLLASHARSDSQLGGLEPDKELGPAVSPDALPQLLELVQHMDAVAYTSYQRAYVAVRAKALDAVLQRAGMAKVAEASAPADMARIPPEALTERAGIWARVMRWLVAFLGPERSTAAQLLAAPVDSQAVAALAERPLNTLLAFGIALCAGPHVAERLFAFLSVHAAAAEAVPRLQEPLAGPAGAKALQRLDALAEAAGKAAREAFEDLEASVGRGDSRPAGPDGTVHPLTASSMHALRRVFDAPQYMDLLCGTKPPPPPEAGQRKKKGKKQQQQEQQCSSEALEVAGGVAIRVIVAVHTQLETRARSLAAKAPALAELFLANNVAYMTSVVTRNPLLANVLGEEWVERQEGEVERHGDALVEATFGAVADALNDLYGLDPGSLSTKDRERVKDKFRAFNEALEAHSQVMPQWSAPDEELRGRLRDKVMERVLRPYLVLFTQYADSSFTKFKEKYVRHTPQEAARAVASFFEGR
jgi:hypothetical protein